MCFQLTEAELTPGDFSQTTPVIVCVCVWTQSYRGRDTPWKFITENVLEAHVEQSVTLCIEL